MPQTNLPGVVPDGTAPPAGGGWRFGPFVLEGGVLRHAGEVVRLTPKEQGVLTRLATAEGRVVGATELLDAVWPGEAVGPESLNRCVSTLRARLGGLAAAGAVIETLHRRGYRLALPVQRLGPGSHGFWRSAASDASSPRARGLLAQAQAALGRRTPADLAGALRAAEAATEADAGCVAAWTAVAYIRALQAMRRYVSPRLAGALALRAAERALALQPDAAEALAARGWVWAVIEGRPEGLADLDAAARADPANWLVHHHRGWALASHGRAREGVQELEAARELLPVAQGLVAPHGWLLFCAGEPWRALEVLRAGAEDHPYGDAMRSALALVAGWLRLDDEAIAAGEEAVRLTEGAPCNQVTLAYALARAGRRAEAAALVEAMSDPDGPRPPPTHLAPVLLELGRAEEARAALARAEAEGCASRGVACGDPRFTAPGLGAAPGDGDGRGRAA